MSAKFASGKHSIAECDRCGFTYPLKTLRALVIKTKVTGTLVCKTCWEPDQPQLLLGMYPVNDAQAVRNPRRDNSYWQSGQTGLQVLDINPTTPNAKLSFGYPSDGSRVVQWGWNPVGLNNPYSFPDLVSTLVGVGAIGTVTVTIS